MGNAIHPGYLNRQSLLGEHNELHAIVSVITNNKKGYSYHPETVRWKNNLSGLKHRHDLLVSEILLRGFNHNSPLILEEDILSFPSEFIDSPLKQFAILKDKYIQKDSGRIPLPVSAQQLWAQHKYSVMAHDPNYYRRIGAVLAESSDDGLFEKVALEFVNLMRQKPEIKWIINSLQHMWGYVSSFEKEKYIEINNPAALLDKIQELALSYKVKYLMESTALSELLVWIK